MRAPRPRSWGMVLVVSQLHGAKSPSPPTARDNDGVPSFTTLPRFTWRYKLPVYALKPYCCNARVSFGRLYRGPADPEGGRECLENFLGCSLERLPGRDI